LNGFIENEVYVKQPSGYIDLIHANFIFILEKTLYDLK